MSFDIFAAFATDENLENNGATFQLGGGSTLLIARGGNRRYSKAITKAVEARRVELDGEDAASEKASDEIMIGVMAETILLGWQNLSFKGEEMGEYSVEKTGYTFVPIKQMDPYVSSTPTSCQMKRPAASS